MSLNREEQLIFDYLQRERDERQFWQDKVRGWHARVLRARAAEGAAEPEQEIPDRVGTNAAHRPARSAAMDFGAELERALGDYFRERSQVVEPFRSAAAKLGGRRPSLRNLADFLLRLWGPEVTPRPGASVDARRT